MTGTTVPGSARNRSPGVLQSSWRWVSSCLRRLPPLHHSSNRERLLYCPRAFQEGEELRKQGSAESYRKAIEKYKEVLILFRVEGNRTGEALMLNNIGFVYEDLGDRQKALDYYNQALLLAWAVGDRAGEVVSLGLKAWAEGDTEQLRYCPVLTGVLLKSTRM